MTTLSTDVIASKDHLHRALTTWLFVCWPTHVTYITDPLNLSLRSYKVTFVAPVASNYLRLPINICIRLSITVVSVPFLVLL